MYTKTHVTQQQLADYIRSKADSPLNMCESKMVNKVIERDHFMDPNCGCLFLQYIRDDLDSKQVSYDNIYCGFDDGRAYYKNELIAVYDFDISYNKWCPIRANKVTKFSDLVIPELVSG